MPYRLTKIYTRKGDKGYTSIGEERLPKDDLLIEAIGTLDELNSAIGLVLALQIKNKEIEKKLILIQNELFDLGGELHAPDHVVITDHKTRALEEMLDEWNTKLPPLKEFLLPGGNPSSAACHLARTICRRAERALVKLHRQIPLRNQEMIRYINRLSDVLFVAARMIALDTHEEKMWDHEKLKKPPKK